MKNMSWKTKIAVTSFFIWTADRVSLAEAKKFEIQKIRLVGVPGTRESAGMIFDTFPWGPFSRSVRTGLKGLSQAFPRSNTPSLATLAIREPIHGDLQTEREGSGLKKIVCTQYPPALSFKRLARQISEDKMAMNRNERNGTGGRKKREIRVRSYRFCLSRGIKTSNEAVCSGRQEFYCGHNVSLHSPHWIGTTNSPVTDAMQWEVTTWWYE